MLLIINQINYKTLIQKISNPIYQSTSTIDIDQNKAMELISQEIKIREIAEAYLRIEQNTEYLTNIQRYSRFKKKLFIKFQNQNIDIRSFFKLIVQSVYLLYTCYVKKVNIYLSNQVYCFTRRDQTSDIYVEYIIEIDLENGQQNEVTMCEKHFKKYLLDCETNSQSYGEYVIRLIKFYLQKTHKHMTLIKQSKKTIPNQPQLIRQITNLQSIIKHIQINIKRLTSPKAVILCLQQSQMFMQYSILLKIMNNSIYSGIRLGKNSMDIFRYIVQLENKLFHDKSKVIMPKDIQMSIQECFKFLIKENIVSSEQSLNDSKSSNKNYVLGQVQGKDDERKFLCKIKIFEKVFNQFTNKTLQTICEQNNITLNQMKTETHNNNVSSNMNKNQEQMKKKIQKSDYLIQFITNKNLLCVKYITDIELNIQNTDMIMFQCNNISFNWNTVSMELVEKGQSKTVKRKERFVAFKTLAQFSAKEKPLFKILLLIDLVMICAKISEPELKRTAIKLEDYWKVQQIGNKINHVINLFIKKVDKIYKNLSNQQRHKM